MDYLCSFCFDSAWNMTIASIKYRPALRRPGCQPWFFDAILWSDWISYIMLNIADIYHIRGKSHRKMFSQAIISKSLLVGHFCCAIFRMEKCYKRFNFYKILTFNNTVYSIIYYWIDQKRKWNVSHGVHNCFVLSNNTARELEKIISTS